VFLAAGAKIGQPSCAACLGMALAPDPLAFLFLLGAAITPGDAPAASEKRVALVIGNNDYKNVPKLQKAVNDARAMGDTLKQLGFTVMVAENQNRQQFSQSLLAFDNAVDPEAVKIKGIKSEVAGRAQILLVPDLEAGNMLAKNLAYFAKADSAGIVLGARVPIVLTSRADSLRARMASCAVATLYADARRRRAATVG